MTAYTYPSLVIDLIDNMEEDSAEFRAALPNIIGRAQEYIQRRIDPLQILRFATVSTSAGSRELALPSDLLVLKSLTAEVSGEWRPLYQQTNEYLTAYWPVYTSVDTPKYYAPKDNTAVFLAPTPANNAAAQIEYVPRVTVLSSALPSNWFSQNTGTALFNAAMMYSNMWTKNASAVPLWKTATDEELAIINNEARRGRRSDSSDRTSGAPENNIAEGGT